jgi:alanine dehydrogenase
MTARIGIRREDKNPWERRTPLIPSHVRELLKDYPLEIWIQPSPIRIFSDEDFTREGAEIREDIFSCPVVFAVKEIPLHFFRKNGVYVFFSHTIKGQSYNMPLLKKMIQLGCTLIDYERIVDEKGQRLVFFGVQAGQAGMIDTLWALGRRLSWEGIENPFNRIKQAFQYGSLIDAKEDIKRVGWHIHEQGIAPSLVPLVCGFAGYGRVSQGAQEIYDLLTVEEIKPERLPGFFAEKNYASNRVYKVEFKEKDMVEPLSPSHKFVLQDYYSHPEKYRPVFASYLPYLTVMMNCIFWTPQYPRFVSKKHLKKLWRNDITHRLRVIGDISCDVEGSVECTVRCTTPEEPVFVFDPITEEVRDSIEGRGVVVMAIDNLPAELSLESSLFFSKALKPFVIDIVRADYSGDFSKCDLPLSIKKAVILYKGEFTPDYEFMKDFLK